MPNVDLHKKVFQPQAILPETRIYLNTCAIAGVPVTQYYIPRYDAVIRYLKSTGTWNNLSSLFFDFTGDKIWALIDIKDPTRTASKVNTYAGEFTVNQGWNGNASFSILTNYNPTNDSNVSQNNFSFGTLLINNVASTTRHAISAFNAGFTQGNFINEQIPQSIANNSATAPTTSYAKYRFTSYAWIGCSRTGSTTNNVYVNGVLNSTQTSSSVAFNNISIGRLNAYNGSWAAAATFGSNNSQGAFYAGNGSVNHNDIITAANIFLDSISTRANVNKRVIFEGDSMTGSVASPTLSSGSLYPTTVITTLGTQWSGLVVSEANETVQSAITQATTEIDPYRNKFLQEDIIVIFMGTNDLATNRTAAQLYADMVTWATARKVLGFKVIIVGICDRDAGFTGGQTQAGFDTARASYRALMNADFNVATSVANTFRPAAGITYADFWIDISADSKFNNAADLTYFQADQIHLNSTAYPILANTYVAPTIQLL